MRFEDLSPEDQRLVETDFGSFEKEAAEQAAVASEMYDTGFFKLASETADYLEELYSQEKVAEEAIALDDESEKIAQECGAFIERGFFDGLMKLGQERYNDPMAYIMPFVEEKVAAEGGKAARTLLEKAKGGAKKLWEGTKDYHKGALKDIQGKGRLPYEVGKKSLKTRMFHPIGQKLPTVKADSGKEKAQSVARGALKFAPHAAVAGAAVGGGVHAYKKHNKD